MTYDSAGNLTNDTYSGYGQGTFNADNRMVSAQDSYAGWTYYTYNADGQRVRRKINNVETWAIYGLDGEMVAEYAASAATTSPQKEYGYRNGQLLVTAEPPPTFNGYLNRRTITIDHTKVPNTDQTNFPVLISGTYSYLATTSNGGNVQNANGYDVIFTSDSNCATKLAHEVETYTASNGAVNYWVKVATASHSTDTVIYMCYGNAAITTDQSNKTGVWDSNFKGVWHLNDNAANTVVSDSPGANNGTNQANTSTKTTNGKTAKALLYNSSSDYTDMATNVGNYTLSDSFTVEAWVNPALDSANRAIFGNAYALAGYLLRVTTVNKVRFVVCTNGSNWAGRDSSTLSAGWHHVVGEWNGSTTHVYIDGVLDDAAAVSGGTVTTITTTAHTRIGATPESGYQSYFNGTLDEVRSSKTARSADWIKTEYNNQSSPASFYSVSAVSGGATLHWLVSDQLGTPRMIFDQTGNLANVKRHDYLPFGEEIAAGISGRTSGPTGNGYGGGDGVRQKFTQKERDFETNLDYFLARYHSSTQGRFISPDPYFGSVFLELPQSWNRYSYCVNDPLNTVDPDGLAWVHDTEKNLYIWVPDADYKSGNAYFDNQDRYEALTQDEIGPNGTTFTVGEVSGSYDTPENRALMGQEAYLGADGKVHALYPPLTDEMNQTVEGQIETQRIGAHNRQEIADFLGARFNSDWSFTPNPNVTHNEAVSRAKATGFTWYGDLHPEHWGGSDYEGKVNGTWYHLTIGYGTSPSFITAFSQEHFYRPSGMHRIDWLLGGYNYDRMDSFREHH
jgi:RHS repeat-associated protein